MKASVAVTITAVTAIACGAAIGLVRAQRLYPPTTQRVTVPIGDRPTHVTGGLEHRLIGTWEVSGNLNGQRWVFSPGGRLTITDRLSGTTQHLWWVRGDRLYWRDGMGTVETPIWVAPDGSTMSYGGMGQFRKVGR